MAHLTAISNGDIDILFFNKTERPFEKMTTKQKKSDLVFMTLFGSSEKLDEFVESYKPILLELLKNGKWKEHLADVPEEYQKNILCAKYWVFEEL